MLRLAAVAAATDAVYLWLVVLLRILGRRQLAELSIVDLAVVLCLGSSVETAMIRADVSLEAGIISAVTLLLTNRVLNTLVVHSRWARRWLVGGPTLIVHNGRLLAHRAFRVGLTSADVEEALREREISTIEKVRYAVVEADGNITVVRRS